MTHQLLTLAWAVAAALLQGVHAGARKGAPRLGRWIERGVPRSPEPCTNAGALPGLPARDMRSSGQGARAEPQATPRGRATPNAEGAYNNEG
eukprot:scaffold149_cov383-Prasinococcus_capsulatus_cf.AAC.8